MLVPISKKYKTTGGQLLIKAWAYEQHIKNQHQKNDIGGILQCRIKRLVYGAKSLSLRYEDRFSYIASEIHGALAYADQISDACRAELMIARTTTLVELARRWYPDMTIPTQRLRRQLPSCANADKFMYSSFIISVMHSSFICGNGKFLLIGDDTICRIIFYPENNDPENNDQLHGDLDDVTDVYMSRADVEEIQRWMLRPLSV